MIYWEKHQRLIAFDQVFLIWKIVHDIYFIERTTVVRVSCSLIDNTIERFLFRFFCIIIKIYINRKTCRLS